MSGLAARLRISFLVAAEVTRLKFLRNRRISLKMAVRINREPRENREWNQACQNPNNLTQKVNEQNFKNDWPFVYCAFRGSNCSFLDQSEPPDVGCYLLMSPRDGLQNRSVPVLGRSNVQPPESPGKCDCVPTAAACCARGRAHPGVVYPTDLAVPGTTFSIVTPAGLN
jgi:hypothetical protein